MEDSRGGGREAGSAGHVRGAVVEKRGRNYGGLIAKVIANMTASGHYCQGNSCC